MQALLEQQLAAEEQRLLVCINASATFVSGISVLRQAHEMLMSQIMQQSPAGGAGAGSGDAGGGGSGNGGGGSGQQTGSGGRARQASGGSGRGQGGGDVAAAARGSDGTRGTAGSGSGSDVSHRHLIGRVQDIAGRLQGSLDAANKVRLAVGGGLVGWLAFGWRAGGGEAGRGGLCAVREWAAGCALGREVVCMGGMEQGGKVRAGSSVLGTERVGWCALIPLFVASQVTIHDVLGRGGCGIVYLGASLSLLLYAHH